MRFFTSTRRRGALLVAIGALLLVVGSLGAVSSAHAQQAEPVNSTVEVGNYTDAITVQVTFNGTISDANATADYTIEDPNGTQWATGTLAGNASETVLEEVDVADSDALGTYTVLVSAESGVVDSGIAGTLASEPGGGGGSGGGLGGMSATQLGILAVLAVVVGAAILGEP